MHAHRFQSIVRRGARARLAALVLAIVCALTAAAFAQDAESLPVRLLLGDGSEVPFEIELYRGEIPFVRLHDGERGALATVRVERGEEIVAIDLAEIARVDRVLFMDVRWFVTLRSGEVREAASAGDGAFFEMAGTTAAGERVRWTVDLGGSGDAPFAGVIFAPELGFPVPDRPTEAP